MAIEIERKFIVDLTRLSSLPEGERIVQGYMPTEGKAVVRARIKGSKAFLTVKGENVGMARLEFEYPIPYKDAEQIISELCQESKIEKTRYDINHGDHLWELDVFHGENEGLVVAEVELESESEDLIVPDWAIQEVTGIPKYYNSNLITNPYLTWENT